MAVLLGALVRTGTTFAQCPGSVGDANTACGSGALSNPTAGDNNSAFGFGALGVNTDGIENTASGSGALSSNTEGYDNTADGVSALRDNRKGHDNTAIGAGALFTNGADPNLSTTDGIENTASGSGALLNNNAGSANTASGFVALFSNTTGSANTADGAFALRSNTGSDNTASGYGALLNNLDGGENTASGGEALWHYTTGSSNTASGFEALFDNMAGHNNTASGTFALSANMAGNNNTASGFGALGSTTGSNNIGVGSDAGLNIATGSNNIDIGNAGVAGESNGIRIGTTGKQLKTFIAGINNSTVTGATVMISSGGRLGVAPSAARFKRNILPMDENSSALMQLRPVTFIYKSDPSNTRQYGLVAEQVRKIYPELVTYDDKGKLQSVRYEQLIPMLLNELQKQATETRELTHRLETKDRQLAAQQREIDALKQQNASINALSKRLTALEQQARMAHPEPVLDRSRASRHYINFGRLETANHERAFGWCGLGRTLNVPNAHSAFQFSRRASTGSLSRRRVPY
jgi:trimeric autotransporter adhesin